MSSVNILGFEVTAQSPEDLVSFALEGDKVCVVNTINPHSYTVQKSDNNFSCALFGSDYLIPDGSGIVLAARVLHNCSIQKVAGYDLFLAAMSQLASSSGRVFFLGSSPEVLSKIKERLLRDYPSVDAHYLSPEYKVDFGGEDVKRYVRAVNLVSPDVLFVGLTAPKQEKLIHAMKNDLNVKLVSGIGAVFDFYAGTVTRPGPFWVALHLEWLPRLLKEPRRLWRRNFVSTPIFIFDMLREKLKLMASKS